MHDLVRSFGSISVVIPAYNAESMVAETLQHVRGWLEQTGLPHEILLVDDGSTDRTAAVAAAHNGVQVLRNENNRGKGYSVRRGMLTSRFPWALFMDVDNSTSIEHLERFATHAGSADVIIASRRLPGARIVRRQSRLRQSLGRTFPYLVRALALPEVRDSQCGFKVFRRRAVELIFPRQRVDRFAFDVEVLLLAKRLGLRLAEVPVDWDNPTGSTLRIRSDAVRMLADLLRVTWRLRLLRLLPDPSPPGAR